MNAQFSLGSDSREPREPLRDVEAIDAATSPSGHDGGVAAELARLENAATLDALTAAIAHEINQPLSGIFTNSSACLRMLSAEQPDLELARAAAARAIRDGNRASDIIRRLRASFVRRPLRLDPVDLHRAAREVLMLASDEIRHRGVTLSIAFPAPAPVVLADRTQLQQVILNLIRNALDAMDHIEDRDRLLTVGTERLRADRTELSVRDSGSGFDALSVERMFEAFYSTKPDGIGVGLAISRSIIERYGGQLRARPNAGFGSTFSFVIPCREVDEHAGAVAAAAVPLER